jgi:hypothetical protein
MRKISFSFLLVQRFHFRVMCSKFQVSPNIGTINLCWLSYTASQNYYRTYEDLRTYFSLNIRFNSTELIFASQILREISHYVVSPTWRKISNWSFRSCLPHPPPQLLLFAEIVDNCRKDSLHQFFQFLY